MLCKKGMMWCMRVLPASQHSLNNGRHFVGIQRALSSGTFKDQLLTYTGGSVDLKKDDKDGIAVVTLNNPTKKNALSGKMMVDLCDIVTELESWDAGKGVVLQGANNTFCSGGDLDTVKNILTSELGYKMADFMHDVTTRFLNLPLISVGLAQGSALGGGAELLTACDFRLVTAQARVGFVQLRMGVTTGWGGGTRLVKIVGRRNALDILCYAGVIDAQALKDIGLADEILPETETSLFLAKEWLKQYCKSDSNLIRTVKSVVSVADGGDMDVSLANERELFSKVWGSQKQKDALNDNIKH